MYFHVNKNETYQSYFYVRKHKKKKNTTCSYG